MGSCSQQGRECLRGAKGLDDAESQEIEEIRVGRVLEPHFFFKNREAKVSR